MEGNDLLRQLLQEVVGVREAQQRGEERVARLEAMLHASLTAAAFPPKTTTHNLNTSRSSSRRAT